MTRYDGRPPRLPDADIIRLYRETGSSTDASLRGNCSVKTVLDILHRHGEPIRPRGQWAKTALLRRLTLSDDDIERRYRAGETCAAIARDAGCHETKIGKILRARGVPMRRFTDYRRSGKRARSSAGRQPSG